MSQKIVQDINNIVDKEKSEYYRINKRKRLFWHSKSVTISCRVRNKNNFNKAPEMALNIRAFLLGEEKYFDKIRRAVTRRINEEDRQKLRQYVYDRFIDDLHDEEKQKEKLDKKMGLIIMSLDESEIRAALNLEYVVSCRLLGYEKELFYLKCYSWGILPVFMLRVLYHTKYSHLKLKKYVDDNSNLIDPYKGLDFSWYLDKIRFL